MAALRLAVSPSVLAWARTSAGYEPQVAAKRLGVSPATLAKWESGDLDPTVTQLRNASSVYHRPLSALLLPHPPKVEESPVADFRRLGVHGDASWSPPLRTAIRRAQAQRRALLEVLAATSEPQALRVSALADLPTTLDAPDTAEILRAWLDLDAVPGATWQKPNEALNAALGAVESLGVLVVQVGRIPLTEMRGFSIAQWPIPIIALNGSDWPRPRLFTLLHEVAHLALRTSGLCDLHEAGRGSTDSSDVLEHRCNEIAAAVLMPEGRFFEAALVLAEGDASWSLDSLAGLGAQFGASSEAVLLRLVSVGLVDWTLYHLRKPQLDDTYAVARREEKARQQEKGGGPSFYVVKVRDLGRTYVRSVLEAFDAETISSRDVVDYLDVRFDQLAQLRQAAGA